MSLFEGILVTLSTYFIPSENSTIRISLFSRYPHLINYTIIHLCKIISKDILIKWTHQLFPLPLPPFPSLHLPTIIFPTKHNVISYRSKIYTAIATQHTHSPYSNIKPKSSPLYIDLMASIHSRCTRSYLGRERKDKERAMYECYSMEWEILTTLHVISVRPKGPRPNVLQHSWSAQFHRVRPSPPSFGDLISCERNPVTTSGRIEIKKEGRSTFTLWDWTRSVSGFHY